MQRNKSEEHLVCREKCEMLNADGQTDGFSALYIIMMIFTFIQGGQVTKLIVVVKIN